MAKPKFFYGIHAVTALLEYRGHEVTEVFLSSERKTDPNMQAILTLSEQLGISVQLTNRNKLEKKCNSTQHQGVVALAPSRKLASLADELTVINNQSSYLILILDQVTDPHNLGACLRTAVAMGVDSVVLPKRHSAPITPSVAKVAVGAAEIINIVEVTNLAQSMETLKSEGVFIIGTALTEAAKPLSQCDLRQKCAIVMGAEGDGMRALTQQKCDELTYIPMIGSIQSLNVSVATGMALYEAMQQRQNGK